MTVADHLVHDMPDRTYHAMTALSSTGARKLLPPSTPAHFKHWRDKPQTFSDAFDMGHVVHRLILGKGAEYVALDPTVHGLKADGTPAANPTATAAWKLAVGEAREAGYTPIHVNDLAAAQEMAAAVFRNAEGNALFANDGDAEVSVFADDPVTGTPLRARFDWLDGDTIVDVKTAMTGAPNEFDRSAAKYGYHIQEMFYRHVAESAGLTINRFVFLVVEKGEPHLVSIHEWDEEARREGKRLVRQAIDTYARCTELDVWPGYAAETNYMSLPTWMLDELELTL